MHVLKHNCSPLLVLVNPKQKPIFDSVLRELLYKCVILVEADSYKLGSEVYLNINDFSPPHTLQDFVSSSF